MAGTQAVLQGDALALAAFADALHHQFFGDRTGQFGAVPIFAPFNYGRGHAWGSELAVRYARYGAWPLPYGGMALRVAPAGRLLADQEGAGEIDLQHPLMASLKDQ